MSVYSCIFSQQSFVQQSLTRDCRQIPKLSKIYFSVECFTADILRYFSTNVKIWLLGGRLGSRDHIEAFRDFLEIS